MAKVVTRSHGNAVTDALEEEVVVDIVAVEAALAADTDADHVAVKMAKV